MNIKNSYVRNHLFWSAGWNESQARHVREEGTDGETGPDELTVHEFVTDLPRYRPQRLIRDHPHPAYPPRQVRIPIPYKHLHRELPNDITRQVRNVKGCIATHLPSTNKNKNPTNSIPLPSDLRRSNKIHQRRWIVPLGYSGYLAVRVWEWRRSSRYEGIVERRGRVRYGFIRPARRDRWMSQHDAVEVKTTYVWVTHGSEDWGCW